ncbi:MAG: hypothetical protein O7G85_07955 [Planctomycetota bacterium]|nr:hypothetical protein [Planctomycetota bacterium]
MTQSSLGQSRIPMPDFSHLFSPAYSSADLKIINARLKTRPEQQIVLETLLSDYLVEFTLATSALRSRITDLQPMESDMTAAESRSRTQIQSDLEQTIEAIQKAHETGDMQALAELQQNLKDLHRRSDQEMEAIRPQPVNQETSRVVSEKIIDLLQNWRIERRDLQTGFEASVITVLDADQVNAWSWTERHLRRLHELQDSRLSGESMDIWAAYESSAINEVKNESAEALLADYESEMDGLLKEKREYLDNSKFELFYAAMARDMGRGEIVVDHELELRRRIQQVNVKYAQAMSRFLDEDQGSLFIRDLRTKSFPRVYRPTRTHRVFGKVASLADLETERLLSVKALILEYEAAYDGATEDLYQITLRYESDLERMRMLHRYGLKRPESISETPEPIQEAYQARIEIDREFERRLREILGESRFASIGK